MVQVKLNRIEKPDSPYEVDLGGERFNLPPIINDQFILLRQIGQGGQGAILKCQSKTMSDPQALVCKIVSSDYSCLD